MVNEYNVRALGIALALAAESKGEVKEYKASWLKNANTVFRVGGRFASKEDAGAPKSGASVNVSQPKESESAASPPAGKPSSESPQRQKYKENLRSAQEVVEEYRRASADKKLIRETVEANRKAKEDREKAKQKTLESLKKKSHELADEIRPQVDAAEEKGREIMDEMDKERRRQNRVAKDQQIEQDKKTLTSIFKGAAGYLANVADDAKVAVGDALKEETLADAFKTFSEEMADTPDVKSAIDAASVLVSSDEDLLTKVDKLKDLSKAVMNTMKGDKKDEYLEVAGAAAAFPVFLALGATSAATLVAAASAPPLAAIGMSALAAAGLGVSLPAMKFLETKAVKDAKEIFADVKKEYLKEKFNSLLEKSKEMVEEDKKSGKYAKVKSE